MATAITAAQEVRTSSDTLRRIITNEWPAAALNGDVTKYVSFLTEDMVYMPPNQEAFTDKNALREWLRQAFASATFDIKIRDPDEIVVTGDWAFARYRVDVVATTISGDKITMNRKYLDIWRRIDGSWKCHRHMWNDNITPVTEKSPSR